MKMLFDVFIVAGAHLGVSGSAPGINFLHSGESTTAKVACGCASCKSHWLRIAGK